MIVAGVFWWVLWGLVDCGYPLMVLPVWGIGIGMFAVGLMRLVRQLSVVRHISHEKTKRIERLP